jgi:hypothetical protein
MRLITRFKTMTSLAAVIATVALVAGCSPSEPLSKRVSEPTTTLPFANDEEALAAAQETYEEFMAIANVVIVEGGAYPERIDDIATAAVATVEKEGFADFAARNLSISGSSIVRSATLQSYTPQAQDGQAIVKAYFCIDISAVDVVDKTGTPVANTTRPDTTPFEITFDLIETSPPRLVVSAKNVWDGDGVC